MSSQMKMHQKKKEKIQIEKSLTMGSTVNWIVCETVKPKTLISKCSLIITTSTAIGHQRGAPPTLRPAEFSHCVCVCVGGVGLLPAGGASSPRFPAVVG